MDAVKQRLGQLRALLDILDQRREKADQDMRLLLAYAREHVTPRPYRLGDLAQAAGMSISGVRTAYSQADIDQAGPDRMPLWRREAQRIERSRMVAVNQHMRTG